MQVIVIATLSLIVLVVLAFVFRENIGRTSSSLFKIGEDAEEGARGVKCVSFMTSGTHKCAPSCETGWREIYPAGEKWTDCDNKCCEKGAS